MKSSQPSPPQQPPWCALLLGLVALFLVACSIAEDPGKGSVAITLSGDTHVSGGIPATEFADGWAISYSRYLVALGGLRVSDSQGQVGAHSEGSWVAELSSGRPQALATMSGLAAQTWDRVSFEVLAPSSAAELLGATDSDRLEMIADKAGILVEGIAQQGGVTKRFRWSFVRPTLYDSCEAMIAGKKVQGVVVREGSTEQVELTVHGEHLFYDDLQSRNTVLRFNPIALADRDGDGDITLGELSTVRLVEVGEGTYGTGSAVGVNTLGDFVTAQAQSVVHYRGEGGCVSSTIAGAGR